MPTPHELSGGMRQRVAIAIAMAADPAVIVADEPTTALDPTLQRQVLDVLAAAQRQTGAALVLVSHDLRVVEGAVDRVGVLYAGAWWRKARSPRSSSGLACPTPGPWPRADPGWSPRARGRWPSSGAAP